MSVILSTGGCLPHCMLGYTSGQTPLQADIRPGRHSHPSAWVDIPPRQTPLPSQWRVQDFPEEGAPTPRGGPTYDFDNFPINCIKLKEFGPGGCASLAPPPLISATTSDTTEYGQQAGGTHPTGMHTSVIFDR